METGLPNAARISNGAADHRPASQKQFSLSLGRTISMYESEVGGVHGQELFPWGSGAIATLSVRWWPSDARLESMDQKE